MSGTNEPNVARRAPGPAVAATLHALLVAGAAACTLLAGAAVRAGEANVVAAESLGMARAEADSEANHPGEKVLVVVGSSHTAYFEAYLDALDDFELVRLETVIAQ